jgi:hypothetical protein
VEVKPIAALQEDVHHRVTRFYLKKQMFYKEMLIGPPLTNSVV